MLACVCVCIHVSAAARFVLSRVCKCIFDLFVSHLAPSPPLPAPCDSLPYSMCTCVLLHIGKSPSLTLCLSVCLYPISLSPLPSLFVSHSPPPPQLIPCCVSIRIRCPCNLGLLLHLTIPSHPPHPFFRCVEDVLTLLSGFDNYSLPTLICDATHSYVT